MGQVIVIIMVLFILAIIAILAGDGKNKRKKLERLRGQKFYLEKRVENNLNALKSIRDFLQEIPKEKFPSGFKTKMLSEVDSLIEGNFRCFVGCGDNTGKKYKNPEPPSK